MKWIVGLLLLMKYKTIEEPPIKPIYDFADILGYAPIPKGKSSKHIQRNYKYKIHYLLIYNSQL